MSYIFQIITFCLCLSQITIIMPEKYLLTGHSWAVGISEGLEIDFDLQAKVGCNMDWSLRRIKRLEENQYKAIIIFQGINDYRNGSEWLIEKFDELIAESFKKVSMVYVFNIPKYYQFNPVKVNEYLESIQSDSLIILDVYSEYINSSSLHPYSYMKAKNLLINNIK